MSGRHITEPGELCSGTGDIVPNLLPKAGLPDRDEKSRLSRAKEALEKDKEDAANMKSASGLSAGVADGLQKAAGPLTVVDNAATSLTTFFKKRNIVLERVCVVVDAVHTLAEVCAINSVIDRHNVLCSRFTRMRNWRGVCCHIFLR